MNSGYWQVELDPSDREKSAIISRKGLYELKVLPFGLCNAPATFERLIEIVLFVFRGWVGSLEEIYAFSSKF